MTQQRGQSHPKEHQHARTHDSTVAFMPDRADWTMGPTLRKHSSWLLLLSTPVKLNDTRWVGTAMSSLLTCSDVDSAEQGRMRANTLGLLCILFASNKLC